MRKLFKNHKVNYIIIGLLGIIIGGSIGITANTYLLQSNEIQYTSDKSVQQAIEELYVLAENSGGSNEVLPIGTVNVEGYRITIPYTGSYTNVSCVYGIDENYGSIGTVSDNTCTFKGSSANQTLYYKLVATDDTGKIYEKQSEVVTGSVSPISIVSLGDYIYMKPESTSYSITADMTGCVSGATNDDDSSACGGISGKAQTINPSELTVWRVIRKNADGTIDVVSDRVSSKQIYFYSRTGYQNYIGTLNSIANQYKHSNYVQSTRHMGYDGKATKYITDGSYLSYKKSIWKSTTSSSTTVDYEKLGAGDMGYLTDEKLVSAVYGNLIAKNPSGTDTNYWLASRHYVYNSSIYYITLNGRFIDSTNNKSGFSRFFLSYSNGNLRQYSSAMSIRPILTLKSTVKITGGSGTLGNEYRLDI